MARLAVAEQAQWFSVEVEQAPLVDEFRWPWEHDGEWGEVLSTRSTSQSIEIMGLAIPHIAHLSAKASFSFVQKNGSGLKVSIGVASVDFERTYTVTHELDFSCTAGQARIGCLLVPLTEVTRLWRPDSGSEWLQRTQVFPTDTGPNPVLGAKTISASADELLSRALPSRIPLGATDSEADTYSIEKEQDVSVTLEADLKVGDSGPGLTLSASIEGDSSSKVEYDVPAKAAIEVLWLKSLAGSVAVAAGDGSN